MAFRVSLLDGVEVHGVVGQKRPVKAFWHEGQVNGEALRSHKTLDLYPRSEDGENILKPDAEASGLIPFARS